MVVPRGEERELAVGQPEQREATAVRLVEAREGQIPPVGARRGVRAAPAGEGRGPSRREVDPLDAARPSGPAA